MERADLQIPPRGPRHWPSWLAVGLLWLLGRVPLPLARRLLAPLGPLTYHLMGRRRKIAERNIARCLPELAVSERQEILRGTFQSLARMVVETACCWSGSKDGLLAQTRIEGLENLQDAEELGRGVLVLSLHATCIEMGGLILCNKTSTCLIYRPLKNPVIEWYQNRGRLRICVGLIKKNNPRQAIRVLKKGGVLWYAPDQDFGLEQTEFAPFFGIQTATLLATRRFPALTDCAVVPMFPRFDKHSGTYTMAMLPALDNFPSDDVIADLTRVNAIMEAQIRRVPAQYWWIHRRFKTRPPGEPAFYD